MYDDIKKIGILRAMYDDIKEKGILRTKWRYYSVGVLFVLILIIAAIIFFRFCGPIISSHNPHQVSDCIPVILFSVLPAIFISYIIWGLYMASSLGARLEWYLNITKKTKSISRDVVDCPVVVRFASYRAEGCVNVHTETDFDVTVKFGEGEYFTFHHIEDYIAAVKEGEIAKIHCKFYYDANDEVLFIEPLKIIGGFCPEETTGLKATKEAIV